MMLGMIVDNYFATMKFQHKKVRFNLSQTHFLKHALISMVLFCTATLAVYSFALTVDAQTQNKNALQVSKIHSNDGEFAAFILREKGDVAQGHVWLESVKSGQRWRLTNEARPFVGLTFTPDGQSVTSLRRESAKDVIATFDINFKRGLASVFYNELSFPAGQLLAMPMWLDDDKLAYLSHTGNEGVSLMQWSSSLGKHEVLRRYTSDAIN